MIVIQLETSPSKPSIKLTKFIIAEADISKKIKIKIENIISYEKMFILELNISSNEQKIWIENLFKPEIPLKSSTSPTNAIGRQIKGIKFIEEKSIIKFNMLEVIVITTKDKPPPEGIGFECEERLLGMAIIFLLNLGIKTFKNKKHRNEENIRTKIIE